MSRARRMLTLVATVALVTAGCTGGDAGRSTAGAPTSGAPSATPAAVAEPVEVEVLLAGEPVDLEVGPLVVHRDVAVLRLAARTDRVTMLTAFWEVFESLSSPGPNGVRLLDREQRTVLVAARTADGTTVTTRNFSPGGPATDAAQAAAGDGVEVVYAAFAVPTGDAVDVVLTQGGTVPDVPVVDAERAGTLTVPPGELVADPVESAPTIPLESWTELVGGQVRARETPELLTVDVSSDVLFASDSAVLGPPAEEALAALAAQVGTHAGGSLTVVGHTDDVDDDAYNLDLSQRRAAAVADRLGRLVSLTAFDVAIEGRGESEPAVPGTSAEARAANRRVQVLLVPAAEAPARETPAPDEPARRTSDALPEPVGPTAPGADGVAVTDGDDTFRVRLPQVRRLGTVVVGELEVTNTGTRDLALASLATGAWDSRGDFDASLQFAATNVSIPVGTTRLYPLDYLRDAERDIREPLTDRVINGIAPGTTRVVSVVWPDPGTDRVVVEVAPRRLEAFGGVEPIDAPFRLTDVPVVDG